SAKHRGGNREGETYRAIVSRTHGSGQPAGYPCNGGRGTDYPFQRDPAQSAPTPTVLGNHVAGKHGTRRRLQQLEEQHPGKDGPDVHVLRRNERYKQQVHTKKWCRSLQRRVLKPSFRTPPTHVSGCERAAHSPNYHGVYRDRNGAQREGRE